MEERINNTTPETEQKDVHEEAHIVFEENVDFDPIADVKYLSSRAFLQTVTLAMKSVYADFEGCKLITLNNGQNYVNFFFNHNPGPNGIVALTADAPGTNTTKNNTLRSIRLADSFRTNGEKYYLTVDGMSTIRDLLVPGDVVFERNGKVKWGKIVFETADPNPPYAAYNRGAQMLTTVAYIDTNKLAALMYGDEKDANGYSKWEYVVTSVHSLPNAALGANAFGIRGDVMLRIERISAEETRKLAQQLGVQQANGLDIVR